MVCCTRDGGVLVGLSPDSGSIASTHEPSVEEINTGGYPTEPDTGALFSDYAAVFSDIADFSHRCRSAVVGLEARVQ